MMRSAAATVRRPGVRIAPITNTWAFRQVGLVNSFANGTSTATMASGGVSMAGPLREKCGQASLPCSYTFTDLCVKSS